MELAYHPRFVLGHLVAARFRAPSWYLNPFKAYCRPHLNNGFNTLNTLMKLILSPPALSFLRHHCTALITASPDNVDIINNTYKSEIVENSTLIWRMWYRFYMATLRLTGFVAWKEKCALISYHGDQAFIICVDVATPPGTRQKVSVKSSQT
jgi:hypothetical protein